MHVGDPGHCRDGKEHDTEIIIQRFRVQLSNTLNAACYCFTIDGFLSAVSDTRTSLTVVQPHRIIIIFTYGQSYLY